MTPVTLKINGDRVSLTLHELSKKKISTLRTALVSEGIATSVGCWADTPDTLHLEGTNAYTYTDAELADLLTELFETYLPGEQFEIKTV